MAREMTNAKSRAETLLALINHLPSKQRQEVLHDALQAAAAIGDVWQRSKVLTELLPFAPPGMYLIANDIAAGHQCRNGAAGVPRCRTGSFASRANHRRSVGSCRAAALDHRCVWLVSLIKFRGVGLRRSSVRVAALGLLGKIGSEDAGVADCRRAANAIPSASSFAISSG